MHFGWAQLRFHAQVHIPNLLSLDHNSSYIHFIINTILCVYRAYNASIILLIILAPANGLGCRCEFCVCILPYQSKQLTMECRLFQFQNISHFLLIPLYISMTLHCPTLILIWPTERYCEKHRWILLCEMCVSMIHVPQHFILQIPANYLLV